MPDPTEEEAISAYLKVWQPGEAVSSYLSAVVNDARTAFDTAAAFWLATAGYLIALEQIGHTVARRGTSHPGKRKASRKAFVAAIADFGDPPLSDDEANALYDMRCALAHEYGLRNKPYKDWDPRIFTFGQNGPLIDLAQTAWDGTVEGSGRADMTTTVNVRAVRDYVERLVVHLREQFDAGEVTLVMGVKPKEVTSLLAFRTL